MDKLGRSRHFVQQWVYAYRDGGIETLRPRPHSGRPPTLPRDQERRFKERLLAGPTETDQVCSLRGHEAVQILEQEFGVHYTLGGVYDLLHRLGLVCLKPRPRHRKNDPQVMQQWIDEAPLLSTPSNMTTPTRTSRSGSKMKPGSDNKGP
jgi:transposase